jgi:hypothetical protein
VSTGCLPTLPRVAVVSFRCTTSSHAAIMDLRKELNIACPPTSPNFSIASLRCTISSPAAVKWSYNMDRIYRTYFTIRGISYDVSLPTTLDVRWHDLQLEGLKLCDRSTTEDSRPAVDLNTWETSMSHAAPRFAYHPF